MPDPPEQTLEDRLWQWALSIPALAANIPVRHRFTLTASAAKAATDPTSVTEQPTLQLLTKAVCVDPTLITATALLRQEWLWQMSASPHESAPLLSSLEAALLQLAASSHTLIEDTHGIRHAETDPISIDPPHPTTNGRWLFRMPFRIQRLVPTALSLPPL